MATVSHIFGALVCGGVTVYLSRHRYHRQHIPLLITGCAITTLWAILATLYATQLMQDDTYVVLGDILKNWVWCFALLQILRCSPNLTAPIWYGHRYVSYALSWLGLGLMVTTFAIHFYNEWWPNAAAALSRLGFIGQVFLSALGLVLVEGLYRRVLVEKRWAIRTFCLGMGCLFCYDFYLFTDAIFFTHIDYEIWKLRGLVTGVTGFFIGAAASSSHRWTLSLSPSRQVIFKSTLLVGCGLYLITISAIGYYMKAHGGSWGQSMQTIFFIGAVLLMLSVALSETLRAWLKILLAKNFFKLRYDYREEWLKLNQLLTADDKDRNLRKRVIMAFAQLAESSKGLLFIKDKQNNFRLKETWNTEVNSSVTIKQRAFNQRLTQYRGIVELNRLQQELIDSMSDLPKCLVELSWAWAIVPLVYEETLHSFIVLGLPRVPIKINWEIKDLFETVAQQATICLVQQQHAAALSSVQQFEGFNRLAAFMMHDLKNTVNQLTLITQNRKNFKNNPDFIDSAFATVAFATQKIEKLMAQLLHSQQRSQLEKFELLAAIEQAINRASSSQPLPRLHYEQRINQLFIQGQKEEFINIMGNLIDNAKYAVQHQLSGEIIILVRATKSKTIIQIKDNGCGMKPHFIRNYLFQPFETTKGQQGMGIGVYQAQEYVEALGGELTVNSTYGVGTTFNIIFPQSGISKFDQSIQSISHPVLSHE